MIRTTQILGTLTCEVVQWTDAAPTSLAVLCHGYGASGTDLVQLAELLSNESAAAAQARYVFPQGPCDLASVGAPQGRAWWPLDLDYLMRRQQEGSAALAELRNYRFAGLPEARRALGATIELALRQANLSYDRLVIGGFSQGAMLACDLTWRLDEPPAALGIFSGTLIDEPNWRRLAGRRGGLPVVQSHGRSDPILPYESAQALHAMLAEAGCQVSFIDFTGGHTIPAEGLTALAAAFPGKG